MSDHEDALREACCVNNGVLLAHHHNLSHVECICPALRAYADARVADERERVRELEAAILEWRQAEYEGARKDGLYLFGPKYERWARAATRLHELVLHPIEKMERGGDDGEA